MDGLSLLSALSQKMRWTQQRQGLLAQNVANADTPNYRGEELKPFSFADALDGLQLDPGSAAAPDDGADMAFDTGDTEGPAAERQASFEVTPEGNGVTLEDEMMKVTANQMDYQAATTLYSKSLALLRTAIGQG